MKNRVVNIWYILVLLLLLIMIVVGGLTRLTGSGLSMVDWHLILDTIPPLSDQQWQQTFNDYQAYPEYQQLNSHYTLSDFKFIYFWEYFHRLIARVLGLVFFIPLIIFWLKGFFSRLEKRILLIALVCGFLQAYAGWYMVKSGLVNVPHVSHFRLAFHLSLAFLIVLLVFKAFLYRIKPPQKNAFWFAKGLFLLACLQVVIGAFLSGLKGGYGFNTWPLMGTSFMPDHLFFLTPFYQNILENPFAIQFVHRHVGELICFLVLLWVMCSYRRVYFKQSLVLFGFVFLQFLLGVLTLVLHVPLFFASFHQLNAILMLCAFLWFFHGVDDRSLLC